MKSGQTLIAEVKTYNPFTGWRAKESWEERLEIAAEHGDWVAVHTDKRWGGSFDKLAKARERIGDKPLLAKGIHENDDLVAKALAGGAHFVLVVDRIPAEEYREQCLYEPATILGLKNEAARDMKKVWNARNPLNNGEAKIDDFHQARLAMPEGWLCQASGLITIGDVDPSATAVLVGEHLPEFVESL